MDTQQQHSMAQCSQAFLYVSRVQHNVPCQMEHRQQCWCLLTLYLSLLSIAHQTCPQLGEHYNTLQHI